MAGLTAAQAADVRRAVAEALPGDAATIAENLGRKRADRTVRRHLEALAKEGLAELVDGVWRPANVGPIPPPLEDYQWPAHFDDVARLLFTERVAQYQQLSVWDDEDRDLLERYVTSAQVARLSRSRIARRAALAPNDPGGGYSTRGSQGQLVQHPDLKTARDAENDAQKYENTLFDRQDTRGPHEGDEGGDQAGL